jgi:disulfide oxidoreductase YuzD
MNIFYLDNDAKECAKQHMDSHVVKMILEYAQLLSTAHRILDGELEVYESGNRKFKTWRLPEDKDDFFYKVTHINHPSAVWARESKANYEWLARLLKELCKEYTFRYGKVHKTESSGLTNALQKAPKNIRKGKFAPPTPAMPKAYVTDSVLDSYRKYYMNDKAYLAKWKNRDIPSWWQNE